MCGFMCTSVAPFHKITNTRTACLAIFTHDHLFLRLLQTKFDDKCLLYSDVVYEYYNTSTGPHSVIFRIRFGPQSVCEYNLAVSALFSLIYSLIMIGVYIFIYFREKNNKE